jgi:hypothetical protein
MMAFTMSPPFFFSAATAFARLTPAWSATNWMSFASSPVSSASSSSPPAPPAAAAAATGAARAAGGGKL